jgi:hypothetical protein
MDDVLRRLAQQQANLWHIPLATQTKMDADMFTDDGFHLASAGYRRWVEPIADEVAGWQSHNPTQPNQTYPGEPPGECGEKLRGAE